VQDKRTGLKQTLRGEVEATRSDVATDACTTEREL